MDKCLEKYNLPRLNPVEIEKTTGPLTRTEIETMIKKLPTNKSPGPDGFIGKFYQTLRRANTDPSETISKNCRRRDTPKLIL